MLILKLTLFLLNFLLLSCCNVYSDFCDTMETGWSQLPHRTRREVEKEVSANMTKLEMASWVTSVLDNLFGAGYNKQFRPGQQVWFNVTENINYDHSQEPGSSQLR